MSDIEQVGGGSCIQRDAFGALYETRNFLGEARRYVKVRDCTIGPDGNRQYFNIPVPVEMTTAHEAVAWTFYMKSWEYFPREET